VSIVRTRTPRWAVATTAAIVTLATLSAGIFGWSRFAPSAQPSFGSTEMVAWTLIAFATGGLVLGDRESHPPVLASALVGSAAMLGATPIAAAVVAAAGAFGGRRRARSLLATRTLLAALVGASLPGLLLLGSQLGGPSIGRDSSVSLGMVATLWLALAVGIPLAESLGSHLVLQPADRVDVMHMLQRRLEPQTVLAAIAVVAAVTYAAIGPFAVFVLLLPTYAAGIGFRQHEEGRRAVTQTLAAMTQLPEWVGAVSRGHTFRVAEAVEAAAIDLGFESRLRRDVLRAAALHELGHLDGGVVRGDRSRVARSGASVIEQAAIRARVGQIVAMTDPTAEAGDVSEDVAICAQLLARACETDRGAWMRAPSRTGVELAREARARILAS
jgi:hypothetical protein